MLNQREKKIALIAFRQGVSCERDRADKMQDQEMRRRSDSPEGMAILWATTAQYVGIWDKIEDEL